MAKLTMQARKDLSDSDFVFPEKAPGSGSYPIENASHARDALSRSSGTPEEAAVRRAVGRRYPHMELHTTSDVRSKAVKALYANK